MTKITKIIVLIVAFSTLIGAAGVTSAGTVGLTDGQLQDVQDPGDNPNENSEADITVEFSDDCTDFTVESSKDISFVSINFNNSTFTYVKYEGEQLEERDELQDDNKSTFRYEGDTEIKSVVVKSGSTEQTFNCDDGETDAEDPDAETECSDGEDNDGDGATDHPDDPGCETPDDDDERNGQEGPEGDETCDDGVDNDGDGLVDDEDPDCNEGAGDNTCEDGEDNDGDGLTDSEDPDCPGGEGPQGDETCEDGVDNDDDGFVDQEDPDCNEGAQDGDFCDDGIDNDGDNATDSEDDDCPGGEEPKGTCEQGGAFQENTVANEAFGTENEEGPISSEIHNNEEQFQDLEPVVHEGSCVVATADNNVQ